MKTTEKYLLMKVNHNFERIRGRRRVFSAKMTRCKVRILARVFSWQGTTTDNNRTCETTQKVVGSCTLLQKTLKMCYKSSLCFFCVLLLNDLFWFFTYFLALANAVWVCQLFLNNVCFHNVPPVDFFSCLKSKECWHKLQTRVVAI